MPNKPPFAFKVVTLLFTLVVVGCFVLTFRTPDNYTQHEFEEWLQKIEDSEGEVLVEAIPYDIAGLSNMKLTASSEQYEPWRNTVRVLQLIKEANFFNKADGHQPESEPTVLSLTISGEGGRFSRNLYRYEMENNLKGQMAVRLLKEYSEMEDASEDKG